MNSVKREINIDIMKYFLILGMILSHSFTILGHESNIIVNYCNLVSFSGFLFVFGYNVYNAYINKKGNIKKQLISIFRILLVFWISGF